MPYSVGPPLRVLLDISWLGLGHLYVQSRTGGFRAHQQLTRALAKREDCDLLLCANCSSVAFAGCLEYLRHEPALTSLPLLGPRSGWANRVRTLGTSAHAAFRRIFGPNSIPRVVRATARVVDGVLHPRVAGIDLPVDLFHSVCAPLLPPSRRSPPRLLTIYDIVHPRHAHLYDANRVQSMKQLLDSLTAEDWVITTSQESRADLVELRIAHADRVFVTPLAADPQMFYPSSDAEGIAAVRRRLGIPEGPYFLTLGLNEPRKNRAAVIQAFGRAVRDARAHDLTLVLAGPPAADAASGQVPPIGSPERIVATGFVPDDDLALVYSGAMALVFASLHEGFGLPVLEAMRCGTPVIGSNRGSIREVAGDAALLVDPTDTDALSQAMLDVYRDSALRERLQRLGLARAAEFTWERSADATMSAYRAVLAAGARDASCGP